MTAQKKTNTVRKTSRARKRKPNADKYDKKKRGAALAMLDFYGGNVARTSRMLGIPRTTLEDWSHDRGVDAAVQESRIAYRRDIVEGVDEVLNDIFQAIRDRLSSPKTTFYQIVGSAKILMEQRAVTLGRPTSITATLTGSSAPLHGPEQSRNAYEKIVDEVIADEVAAGRPAPTRDAAAKMIIEVQPEAEKFLKISGGEQPS